MPFFNFNGRTDLSKKNLMAGLTMCEYIFGVSRLALSNDPALAMAFSVARRTAAVPILFVNGTYIKTVSNYLDSSIIQHQLRRIDDQSTLKGNILEWFTSA